VPALPLGPDGLPAGWPEDYGLSSLGWDILDWGHAHLAQPDGETAGRPWEWRRWQIRWVVWWYTVDAQGKFLFDRGQIVLIKGGGKSPTAGALGSCALAAPTIFDGFDADGRAVGKPQPSPWVQLAAVSEDQTVNTMALVLAMLREGDAGDVIPGLDLGLTRIYTANGRLEPVTASAPSREGQRLTDAILDESHLWLPGNGGVRLAATIRRNLAKMGGRSIETTNAWRAGEDSVAESTARYADMARDGRTRRSRILRMHPTANVPDLADEPTLRAALATLYADMPWIDVDRIVSEVYDINTDPGDARRFYLNEITSADDAVVSAAQYDACEVEDTLVDGDVVALGFDGGKTDDATALVAVRMNDRLFEPLGIWEPHGTEVDRELVAEAVHGAFLRFKVVGFYADVALWESYIDAWSREYRARLQVKASATSAIGWDMRSRQQLATRGTERLGGAIRDGQIRHGGDPVLRRHVLNARKRPNRYGTSFGKESRESPNKVDGFAAMQLADMARHDLIEKGWKVRTGTGRVVVLQ
jgi:phage terminase large subunit-like protein